MELPFNTTISGDLLKGTGRFTEPVANWSTKRRWVAEAFDALEAAGYHVRSAYTLVKDPSRTRFVYTRSGVAGRRPGWRWAWPRSVTCNGVHMQNLDTWETYAEAIERGELPLASAYRPTDRGAADPRVHPPAQTWIVVPGVLSRRSTGSTCSSGFATLASLEADGFLAEASRDRIALTREGLAARGRAAAALLPARARGRPLYLMPHDALRAHTDSRRRVQFYETDSGRHRPFQLVLPLHGGGRARAVA